MNTPLITDEKDLKWVLLGKILGTVSSRRVKQEMAKQGISPVNLAGAMFKIVLMVMFFSIDITYGGERIAEERRTEEICKIGRNSRSEG